MRFPISRLKPVLTMLFAVAALAVAAPTRALDRGPVSMTILVDGVALEEYAARGTQYIEASEGSEYSIRLRNNTGGRVAVALSVDGLNTIDAKTTTSKKASKWILDPYRTITIDGWQVSNADARRFFFTSEAKSYGAWLGKTRNLGLITAAVFKERPQPRPVPMYREEQEGFRDSGRRAPSAAPGKSESAAAGERSAKKAAPSDDLAATGIGRKLNHRVRQVEFRAESRPSAVLELRYEYHDALVRLGVLSEYDRLSRRERAQGFEEMSFAPDPFVED